MIISFSVSKEGFPCFIVLTLLTSNTYSLLFVLKRTFADVYRIPVLRFTSSLGTAKCDFSRRSAASSRILFHLFICSLASTYSAKFVIYRNLSVVNILINLSCHFQQGRRPVSRIIEYKVKHRRRYPIW